MFSQVWWLKSVMPELGKQRVADYKSEASLDYGTRQGNRKKKRKRKKFCLADLIVFSYC